MASKFRISPPPTANQDSQIWGVWYNQIKDVINKIGASFSWPLLDFTGSNITDIVTRNHEDLQNFQGGGVGEHYHLTSAERNGLTGGGETTLHTHPVVIPAGAIMSFAMNSPPTGWLGADGSAVSRTTYASLFTAIGTIFGAGDGSTTFNLPDLRGEFIRGWDNARGVDSGRTFGSTQTDAFQGHFHDFHTVQWNGGGQVAPYATGSGGAANRGYPLYVKGPTTDGVNGTPRTATETRPRNVALLACIKY